MPKFIGNNRQGVAIIHDNAQEAADRVRLTYSQQRLLPASNVVCSLDTTDRGSASSYAKRWYRWFASPAAINDCRRSTRNMLDRAGLIGPVAA